MYGRYFSTFFDGIFVILHQRREKKSFLVAFNNLSTLTSWTGKPRCGVKMKILAVCWRHLQELRQRCVLIHHKRSGNTSKSTRHAGGGASGAISKAMRRNMRHSHDVSFLLYRPVSAVISEAVCPIQHSPVQYYSPSPFCSKHCSDFLDNFVKEYAYSPLPSRPLLLWLISAVYSWKGGARFVSTTVGSATARVRTP